MLIVRTRRSSLLAILGLACLCGCNSPPPQAAVYAARHPCAGDWPVHDAGAGGPHGADAGAFRRLLPEVIQKIVRDGFGEMRLCYERGLWRNGSLAGEVATKFVIGVDGAVKTAELACTSMPDDRTVNCVVGAFKKLHFPAPDGGMVTVVYPIMFNPGYESL